MVALTRKNFSDMMAQELLDANKEVGLEMARSKSDVLQRIRGENEEEFKVLQARIDAELDVLHDEMPQCIRVDLPFAPGRRVRMMLEDAYGKNGGQWMLLFSPEGSDNPYVDLL